MPSSKNVSFITLNYNGKDILATCLPSLFQAIEFDSGNHEVIVVDNGSSDGSVEFVEQHFPDAKLIVLDDNKMLPGGYNAGVKEAKNEILIILNNDMIVKEDFIEQIVRPFNENEDLFAVTPKFLKLDKQTIDGGKRQGRISKGFFIPYGEHDNELDYGQLDTTSYVLTAEAAAYNRKKFIEIGYLDELFPLYYPFVDLSYRAWKRGYKILYEPDAVVYHMGGVTVNRFLNLKEIELITGREHFLFMWKNFTSHKLLANHLIYLMPLLTKSFLKANFAICKSFIQALKEVNYLKKRRYSEKINAKRSDIEIFELTSGKRIYQYVKPVNER